jgi:formylglycine-generating enzyme
MRQMSTVRVGKSFAACLATALAACVCTCAAADITYVVIADADNPADALGFGAVLYEYRIGAYEVTNAEYVAFLNAVAKADTYGLYHADMWIARTGQPGAYAYATTAGQYPVTHVSWYSAARFVNWLDRGMPSGPQDDATTENGAYTFTGAEAAGPRNEGARFFLATEDEWVKAAYYGGGGVYAEYPLPSGVAPIAGAPGAAVGGANFDDAVANLTAVGAYTGSPSAYGTFDQAGNVWEWVENEIDGERGIRGGSWKDYAYLLSASYRDSDRPAAQYEFLGFRVAAMPFVAVQFRRGDVNQDAQINIADPITVLSYLFARGTAPACLSAADANDDGKTDIADAIKLLAHLFAGSGPLAAPFTSCDADPTPDALGCGSFKACAP